MSTDDPIIDLFNQLLAIPSPSGGEERLGRLVSEQAAAMGYAPETDPAGNVIVRLAGRYPESGPAIIASHMDEIAMVVTSIEPDGTLRVAASGGLMPFKLGEGPVEILGDTESVTGVFSIGSMHRKDAGKVQVTWDTVRVLTGLTPEALAQAGVRPGSCAVPLRTVCGPVFLGPQEDPLIAAWTFDDRMGVAVLLRLLAELKQRGIRPARPTLICFTVHEEGGCHGAKVLAHAEKPEVFIAIDGCPMPPGAPLKLDGRPGVWSMDKVCHYDQRLVRALMTAGQEAGTELQPVVYEGAASDASMVYGTGGAPRVAVMGHVRENSHGYEVARASVFGNVLKTLVRFLEVWE